LVEGIGNVDNGIGLVRNADGGPVADLIKAVAGGSVTHGRTRHFISPIVPEHIGLCRGEGGAAGPIFREAYKWNQESKSEDTEKSD